MSNLSYYQSIDHLIKHCCNLRSDDKFLIIYDSNSKNIFKDFIISAKKKTLHCKSYMTPVRHHHGGYVSPKLKNAMLNSTVILSICKFSLAHSSARIESAKNGARFLSLPAYNKNFLKKKFIKTNYKSYFKEAKKITNLLTKSVNINITSKIGTNLQIITKGRLANCCPGFVENPGDLGSPPDIETNISPIENKSNGIIVIDGSITDPRIGVLKKPLKIIIKKGKIQKFYSQDKKMLNILNKIFHSKSSKRKILAEFGIGLNKNCILTGNMLTDEGTRGCVHFGFGSNSTVGGLNKIDFHLDFVMKKPYVKIGNNFLIKNGKIQKV